MPHSLRARLKNLQRKGELTEKDIDRIFKALEQEPCDVFDEYGNYKYPSDIELTEPNTATSMPCDDVVSRQWLMECVNEEWIKFDTEKDKNRFIHLIRDIAPPITPVRPQEQTGHWIKYPHNSGIVVCNQCKGIRRDCRVGYTNYCNRCGAKMVEPQERSGEE